MTLRKRIAKPLHCVSLSINGFYPPPNWVRRPAVCLTVVLHMLLNQNDWCRPESAWGAKRRLRTLDQSAFVHHGSGQTPLDACGVSHLQNDAFGGGQDFVTRDWVGPCL